MPAMIRTTMAVAACIFLAACGGLNQTPDCGADKTLAVVREIIEREFDERQARARERLDDSLYEFYSPIRFVKIEYVTAIAYDASVDRYDCSARINVERDPSPEQVRRWEEGIEAVDTNFDGSREFQITFSVHRLATDPGQFFVEVNGLEAIRF